MTPSPILVVGPARSGTTLLSMLISRHSRMEILAETNFYSIFQPVRHCYEPLSNSRSLARFVGEVVNVTQHLPLALSAKDILEHLQEPTFPGVFTAWLDAYARRCGKPRSGEKTPQHCQYLDVIQRDLPDSPVLFLVRDPRDSAYSGLHSFGRSLTNMTADWNKAVQSLMLHRERVMVVRYEQLVAEPEAVLRAICDRLGESWDPAVLDASNTTTLFRTPHKGHERLTETVDAKSVGRFRALDDAHIAWIERECAEGMRFLGYEPVSTKAAGQRALQFLSPSSRPSLFSHAAWRRRLFDWRLRLRSQMWRIRRSP